MNAAAGKAARLRDRPKPTFPARPSAGQVEVRSGSPLAGRMLGDTRARTRTGASIVAVVRGEDVIASPSPVQPLAAGDVLVVIGTREGVAGVQRIIQS